MLVDQLNVLMRLMQAMKKIVMDIIRKFVTTSIVYIYQVVLGGTVNLHFR